MKTLTVSFPDGAPAAPTFVMMDVAGMAQIKLELNGEVGDDALHDGVDFALSRAIKLQTEGFESALRSDYSLRERYFSELAWLSQAPGMTACAAHLLAARAAVCASMARGQADEGQGQHQPSFPGLTARRPDGAALETAFRFMLGNASKLRMTQESERLIDALWPLTAPIEQLLVSGGDERLILSPDTGLNKYGCTPWPRPDLLSFSSCTASNLSEAAFAAAESARRSLATASILTSPATVLAEASEAIGTALLRHFGVEDIAQAILAASGTDAALVVTGLLSAETPGEALTSILLSPAETGTGVPDAVQGRHFAALTPSGRVVGKGEPIDGFIGRPALVTVALRDEAGTARAPEQVAADIEIAVETAMASGRVVLHAMEGSKTGLTAPDRTTCLRLVARYRNRLDIVIDACQARIEPWLARWYLEQGFAVLITGSKFYGAPGFCGAVLFPRYRLARITGGSRLPAGLAAYAQLEAGFGSRRCPGLVLRWTAALQAMAQFAAMEAPATREALASIDRHICLAIGRNPQLRLIDAPRPPGSGWSYMRSVFTIAARFNDAWLSAAALRPIYQALGCDRSDLGVGGEVKCQVGQPVELGCKRLGGLRIAISSAQLLSAGDLVEALDEVVAKLGLLLRPGLA